jgi:preprotein translocase subunit YajC
MINLFVLLQAAEGSNLINQFLPLILIVVVFYFFIIRPQQKKTKQQNNFIAALEKGQQVVTLSGIIGRINKIEDNIITIQVDSKTFIKIVKNQISKEMSEAIPPSATEGF